MVESFTAFIGAIFQLLPLIKPNFFLSATQTAERIEVIANKILEGSSNELALLKSSISGLPRIARQPVSSSCSFLFFRSQPFRSPGQTGLWAKQG